MSRLEQAFADLEIDSYDFELRARELNDLLVGYSMFWGTNDNGEAYIEWHNDLPNHSITLTHF